METKKQVNTPMRRTEVNEVNYSILFVICLIFLLGVLFMIGTTSCSKSEITPEFMERAPLGVTLIDPPNSGTQTGTMLKSLGPNRMPNGGGDDALDWYDEDGNGCGDGWISYPPLPGWATQVFAPGMAGVDVVQRVTAPFQFILISPTPPAVSSQWHELRFWYRSTVPVNVVVRLTDRCGYVISRLPACEGNSIGVAFWARSIHSIIWYNSPTQPGVLDIDRVNLY